MRAPPPGSEETWSSEFRRGMASLMPVLIGLVPYALVLGAQAAQKGFSVVEDQPEEQQQPEPPKKTQRQQPVNPKNRKKKRPGR